MGDRIRPLAALIGPRETVERVYGAGRRDRISKLTNLIPVVIEPSDLDRSIDRFSDIDTIFSTWGMPHFSKAQLDRLTGLRAVFYAAGSCQSFAVPLLERGIVLSSAWRANALPVAEFTLAQILLSGKGYWHGASDTSLGFSGDCHGNYHRVVALLGLGAIGQRVATLLQNFDLDVIAYDPFVDAGTAKALGVRLVGLRQAFQQASVVSNHVPDNPTTRGMIDSKLLTNMRPFATFINTGRGATVNHTDLAAVMQSRPDLVALLDVTDPEPLQHDSPLRSLVNVRVTGHIAGSIGNEVHRLADFAIDEFERYRHGKPLEYQVTAAMLSQMA